MGYEYIAPAWRAFYEKKAVTQTFLPSADPAERHRVRMVRRILGAVPASVLDVGCADGYLCHVLRDRVKVPKVMGVDVASAHVDRARDRFPGIPFFRGDARHLPFPDASFELVTAVEVLEHLEDPAAALRELARVAARRVIVTVPFNEKPDQRLCPHCLRTFALDGHIQRFDRSRLETLAVEAGLAVTRVQVYRPWEHRDLVRKLYAPIKRVLFPQEFASGGWLAIVAAKRAAGGRR